MAEDTKELYKKVSAFKDLKQAIKEVKKATPAPEAVKVTKAEDKPEEQKATEPKSALQYLGRKKLLDGVLSHLIGTGADGHNHYQMDVHLEKHSKGIPCITLSLISPKGEVLDHSPDHHKDMKAAIKAIVSHNQKKAWK